MTRCSFISPVSFLFSELRTFFLIAFRCRHFMCKGLSFRCFLCVATFAFFLSSFADTQYAYWGLRYSGGGYYAARVIDAATWPGYLKVQQWFPELLHADGNNYYVRDSDPVIGLTAVWISSGNHFPLTENDVQNLNNYLEAIDDPYQLNLLDFNEPPTTGLPKLKPVGDVILDSSGTPSAVVGLNQNGDRQLLPLQQDGNGYVASGYGENGQPGVWYVGPAIDGSFGSATFTPTGGSGGDTPPDGGETITPLPDNYTPPELNQDGTVATPVQNISIPDGNGGSIHIPFRDYTPLLTQIGVNQVEGFNRLESVLNSSSVPSVAPQPSISAALDSSPADDALQSVSGWGFDFGLGYNPIGNIFTGILGNPPTSFGSVDRVWQIDFNLGFTTVQSTFDLSSWFTSAFRSCVLMFFTIFFAVAYANCISDAFN